MENRPAGREKHITGPGKTVQKRGEGLNSGPVGRSDGYQGRGGSGGGQRASGQRSPLTMIIVLLVALLGGGGAGLSGLLGGGGETAVEYQPSSGYQSQQSSVPMDSSSLSSLFAGGFSGSGVSSGWDRPSNTGKLNSTVADGAREKYTVLRGNGEDTVTLMVYVCGTDLESRSGMATADLQEMTAAALSDKVNLLVCTGGCKQWKNNVVSSSVNQIYKVEQGGMQRLVDNNGTQSMTNPDHLTGFLQFCAEHFPADRYQLILWDHGGGALSGYGYDEKNPTSGSMNLSSLQNALSQSKLHFDFIGFDACLMATLETALAVEPYADYLIASEETEPGIGWYYTNWLGQLSRNTSTPTVELGRQIADDFVSACNQRCPGQKTTLSVVDLAELKATVPEQFRSFAAATSQMLSEQNYQTVSNARSGSREFASSNRIDHVDLVDFATRLDTEQGEALAQALLGAVKYNKTSSSMTNAYGLSVYFPLKKTSIVNSAVATYNAIGMDDDYTRCIQQFASMEVSGQAVSGGAASPLPSLTGSGSGAGQLSSQDIYNILNGLLGGDLAGVSGLTGSNSGFLGRSLDVDSAADYLSSHQLDASALVWTGSGADARLTLSEEQWALVQELQLNVFLDDGEGYIDLGLDNVYDFTEDGALRGDYDGTWLAIDNQPVPYYYVDTVGSGDERVITGRVPVMLNGVRSNLILVFDSDHPYGTIAGAQTDYVDGETDTVAKNLTQLEEGDVMEFVCDYYGYDGSYQNSYYLGEPITYTGEHQISNVYVDGELSATYLFTDLYQQEYWTAPIPQ